MADIHPTAIIDDRAQLADDVMVGPYSVIEGAVKIGPRTRLMHAVSIKGPITIGTDNVFYPNSVIGYEPQDVKFLPDTEGAGTLIGDGNIFREGFNVHRATKDRPTTIGSHGYYMAHSHIGHDCVTGDRVMMANGALLAGHVELADGVIMGGNAVVHQHCRLGRMVMFAGVRGVNKDVPPFCLVMTTMRVCSLNLVGLRRAGYRDDIRPLSDAFNVFFKQGHPVPTALERIKSGPHGDNPRVKEFVAFIRESKRGITPYGSSRDLTETDH